MEPSRPKRGHYRRHLCDLSIAFAGLPPSIRMVRDNIVTLALWVGEATNEYSSEACHEHDYQVVVFRSSLLTDY